MSKKETFWEKPEEIGGVKFLKRKPPEEKPIICRCGLWFATEKDFQEHVKKHKISFSETKKIPREVKVDFIGHGKVVKT